MIRPRPNILVIFCDQLRRDALSVCGDPNISTPHIDALAKSGVTFRNACSTYPICVPFRFTLMTGEYAHSRLVPGIDWRMSPCERTIADELNEAGYETIYVGKWHLYGGHRDARYHNRMPIPRSHRGRWGKWLGFEIRNDPFDTCYFEDDAAEPKLLEEYQTDGLFNLAMNYLERRKENEKPFFCILSVEPPHPPYRAPDELEKKWLSRSITLPLNFSSKDEKEREEFVRDRQIYYAMIENLDQNVGRMTKFLNENQLVDDTIVVFFSDHGELGGSHGLKEKQFPFEESVGIPLIVSDPTTPGLKGTFLNDPTCTEDLFPTLLGLANLKPKQPKHGLDLAPLIRGEIQRLPREGVLLEFVQELRENKPFYKSPWRGLRTEQFKYVVRGLGEDVRPWQFFDLKIDPYELVNRINDPRYLNQIQRCHESLREKLASTEDHFALKELNQYLKRSGEVST
jgi:arylsulfatase A-like enzyme